MTVSPELLSAYRYHRIKYGPDAICRARGALIDARRDVSAGESRYPLGPSAAGRPYESRGSTLRFVERPGDVGLRFFGYAEEIALRSIHHHGWFTDNYQDGKMRGVVYQLPGRNGETRLVIGHDEEHNEDAACLDLTQIFVVPRISNLSVRHTEEARDAAKMADRVTELAAEDERDYQSAWQAGSRWHDLGEEIAATRKSVLAILGERREAKRTISGKAYAALCEAIRDRVADLLQGMADARQQCRKLADGEYVSEWLPGFRSYDKRLREAFNEGAETAVL